MTGPISRAKALGLRRHFIRTGADPRSEFAVGWWTATGRRVVWTTCEFTETEPERGSFMPVVLTWHVDGLLEGGDFDGEEAALEEFLMRQWREGDLIGEADGSRGGP